MPIYNYHYFTQARQHLPQALAQDGAFLEAEIHIPKALQDLLQSQNVTIPAPVRGFALIDTGATRTCADQNALSNLGINPIGLVSMGTAGGLTQCPLYPARLWFPSLSMDAKFTALVGVNLQGQQIAGQQLTVLIGRDILLQALFIYNGRGGFFTLAF